MKCEEIERQLTFYACDELEPAELAAVEEHLRSCAACAAAARREAELLGRLATRAQAEPSAELLEQCRSELAEALDDVADRTGWRARARAWVGSLRPGNWLALHPGWGTAFLLLVGVTLGYGIPRLLTPETPALAMDPALVVTPALSDEDLANVAISGISFVPASGGAGPNVELHLMAQNPIVLEGSVNDPQVRRVLMHVVRNNQLFDSGLRLDSVDVLRTRNDDVQIRMALCDAARNDRNPAVRLKALEALRGFESDDRVRQTLIDALLHDDNPGVRVESINALRALTEKTSGEPDPRLLEVLRDRMQRDPNTYIRIQSAAAVRELSPREVF